MTTVANLIPSINELLPVLWSPTTIILGSGNPSSSIPSSRNLRAFLISSFRSWPKTSRPVAVETEWISGAMNLGSLKARWSVCRRIVLEFETRNEILCMKRFTGI